MSSTRHYDVDEKEVLFKDVPQAIDQHQLEILKLIYTEACSGWRVLTDVRFKLMGFLPVASGAFLLAILSSGVSGEGASRWARAGLVVFGVLITVALWVYDQRNNELYNEFISRGRRIEHELGVKTGLFLGRPDASKGRIPLPKKMRIPLLKKTTESATSEPLIRHGTATGMLYGAVVFVWVFALVIIWCDPR
jgi:hypothetical protein